MPVVLEEAAGLERPVDDGDERDRQDDLLGDSDGE
jgi:hypothetical protein